MLTLEISIGIAKRKNTGTQSGLFERQKSAGLAAP